MRIRRGEGRQRRVRSGIWGVVAAVAALAGCGGGGTGDGETASGRPLRVVATTGMIADLAATIGAERVRVTGLMGPGVDPHLYKASAGDVRTLAGADVIFYNGLHLEAAMAEVLEEMGTRGHTVPVAEEVPPERRIASAAFSGSWDPHVWFDVSLWALAAGAVERTLVELDPQGTAVYAANAAALADTLRALDAWIRQRVEEVPADKRVLVTAHDAFGYFGRAYGFEVVGLQGISTASEVGTADIRRLADLVVRRRIPAMFVETSVSPRTIEAVRAAVRDRGFEVRLGGSLFSDAMGNPGTAEGRYPGMVRHNVNTIAAALAPAAEGPGNGGGAER
ncbi:MAG: zinc ABC transporter substrate-binding protein [Gemmatimonadota bacterium]|nr:zinc ABC transporter substrate-binding protein [Gemmatimonadota bacterium]